MVTPWSPHGHPMVTPWSPHGHPMPPRGHLVVTSWSPRGHPLVTSWSPHGRPECLSVVIFHRLDPYKLGDCASWSHIWRPPPPLIGFFEAYAGPIWGGLGGSHTYIYLQRYLTPK